MFNVTQKQFMFKKKGKRIVLVSVTTVTMGVIYR